MQTVTLYRDNHTDQQERWNIDNLVESFLRSEVRALPWPLQRQVGVWLLDLGTFDEGDHEKVVAAIEEALTND